MLWILGSFFSPPYFALAISLLKLKPLLYRNLAILILWLTSGLHHIASVFSRQWSLRNPHQTPEEYFGSVGQVFWGFLLLWREFVCLQLWRFSLACQSLLRLVSSPRLSFFLIMFRTVDFGKVNASNHFITVSQSHSGFDFHWHNFCPHVDKQQ